MTTTMESSLRRAPKNPKENAAYRRAILDRARGDVEFQAECWIRCARDPIWYCDTFLWTVNPMDYPLCPDRPFILYGEYQEKFLTDLIDAATFSGEGRSDRLIEKSRKMGATWVIEVAAEWLWHFHGGQSILFGSNKEDNVDMRGNPASLMGKLDYLLDRMPGWLRPRFDRTSLLFTNLDNGSIIKGESTNDNFARSGRFGLIFMDEFAAVEHGMKLLAATQAASRCRIICSTHQGEQTAFNQLCVKMRQETPERVWRYHWTLNKIYSRGLYTSEPDERGRFSLKIIDEGYPWPRSSDGAIAYPFKLDGKVRSPWYDEEERSSPNEQVIAQELDINPATSSSKLIHPDKLTAIMARSVRPPAHVGELSFDGEDGVNPRFSESSGGRLRLWCDLDGHGLPPDAKYVVSCDVALGVGGDMSSNSAASVTDKKTGQKVGEFAWFAISPPEFATYSVALCRFFHDAELIWELPGPGTLFAAAIRRIGYPHLAPLWANETEAVRKPSERRGGWQPSKDSKRSLLLNYAYALHNGLYENPSREALLEVGEFEQLATGDIEHVKSFKGTNPDTSGKNHGDRVIADALGYYRVDSMPRGKDEKALLADPPMNTYAWRQKQARDKIKRQGLYGVRRRS